MIIENIAIGLVKPYEKNAKKHDKKQVQQVANSIKAFGWAQPLVVDANNSLIIGHCRLQAAKKLELTEVPVLRMENLSEGQVQALRLADNRLNESAWDMKLVVEELKLLDEGLIDLTGFSQDLIVESGEKDDDVPDVPEEPVSKLGEIYQLGRHRIMCGDSTKVEDVEKLMNGQKADMVFTDPPYNVDYKGKGENTKKGILNDKMSDGSFDVFLLEAFKRIAESVKRTAGCYIFHSHKTASDFEKALELANFHIDTQLIWNKPSAGMGMNDYRTKHEPFFYTYLSKEDKIFYGDRTGTTVWKVPQDELKAFKWFQKQQQNLEGGGSSIWSISRDNVNEYVHPTQKPVELPSVAMFKSSKQDDIVLDTFLGSGTTLIAAEKTGRVCYGMELDPRFIDVIIKRWENYTGETAVKLE